MPRKKKKERAAKAARAKKVEDTANEVSELVDSTASDAKVLNKLRGLGKAKLMLLNGRQLKPIADRFHWEYTRASAPVMRALIEEHLWLNTEGEESDEDEITVQSLVEDKAMPLDFVREQLREMGELVIMETDEKVLNVLADRLRWKVRRGELHERVVQWMQNDPQDQEPCDGDVSSALDETDRDSDHEPVQVLARKARPRAVKGDKRKGTRKRVVVPSQADVLIGPVMDRLDDLQGQIASLRGEGGRGAARSENVDAAGAHARVMRGARSAMGQIPGLTKSRGYFAARSARTGGDSRLSGSKRFGSVFSNDRERDAVVPDGDEVEAGADYDHLLHRRHALSGPDYETPYFMHETFNYMRQPTVRARVVEARLKSYTYRREAITIAVALDCIHNGDVGDATEVLVRRLQAVLDADQSGNWNVARQLESLMTADRLSGVTPATRRRAQRLARWERTARKGKSDDDDSENSDKDDPAPKRKGGGRR